MGLSCSTWNLQSLLQHAGSLGIYFPYQGLNPGPLHWEHGVLATEPPGKSQQFLLSYQEVLLGCSILILLIPSYYAWLSVLMLKVIISISVFLAEWRVTMAREDSPFLAFLPCIEFLCSPLTNVHLWDLLSPRDLKNKNTFRSPTNLSTGSLVFFSDMGKSLRNLFFLCRFPVYFVDFFSFWKDFLCPLSVSQKYDGWLHRQLLVSWVHFNFSVKCII